MVKYFCVTFFPLVRTHPPSSPLLFSLVWPLCLSAAKAMSEGSKASNTEGKQHLPWFVNEGCAAEVLVDSMTCFIVSLHKLKWQEEWFPSDSEKQFPQHFRGTFKNASLLFIPLKIWGVASFLGCLSPSGGCEWLLWRQLVITSNTEMFGVWAGGIYSQYFVLKMGQAVSLHMKCTVFAKGKSASNQLGYWERPFSHPGQQGLYIFLSGAPKSLRPEKGGN